MTRYPRAVALYKFAEGLVGRHLNGISALIAINYGPAMHGFLAQHAFVGKEQAFVEPFSQLSLVCV